MSPSTRRTLARLDDAVVFIASAPLVLVIAARVLVRRALRDDTAPPEAAGPISISVSFPVDVMPPKCAPSTSQSTPTA